MKDSDRVLHVSKGGRQGCRVGGKVFNIIYAVALDLVRLKLQQANISFNIHYNHSAPPWSSLGGIPANAVPTSVAALIDITFVDDAAFFVAGTSPAELDYRIALAVDIIYTVFNMYGLKVNFAKGKTEAIVKYRE